MRKNAKALISWVPHAKGGRRRPPTSAFYSTVARFSDDAHWPEQTWSLVVQKLRSYGDRFWFADVEFLSPEAPQELLRAGARFDLYEGRTLSATGIIRGVNAKPPQQARSVEAVLLS